MAEQHFMPTDPRFQDLTGQRFGKLLVQRYAGRKKRTAWQCLCDCGNTRVVMSFNLKSGHTRSCRCILDDMTINVTHGKTRSPEWTAWVNMNQRCHQAAYRYYGEYGGRGITVCDDWRNSFSSFLSDMGEKPSAAHSIDRIDNNGNYCPENCRWATRHEQARNTRRNRLLTLNGETMCLAEWVDRVGIHQKTITGRLNRGWSDERALTTPVIHRHR